MGAIRGLTLGTCVGVCIGLVLACGGAPPVEEIPASAPQPAGEAAKDSTVTYTAGLEPVISVSDGSPCVDQYSTIPMPPSRVQASSALTEDALVHAADRAFDGDPATAWVEGVAGNGVGEGIVIWLPKRRPTEAHLGPYPDALGILPGYGWDDRRWRSNNRVRTLLLRWLEPRDKPGNRATGPLERADLVYRSLGIRIELQHEGGVVPERTWQYVDVGNYFTSDMSEGDMTNTDVVALELSIVEVDDAGALHDHTAISEIQLLVKNRWLETRCARSWCEEQGRTTEDCANPL